MSSDRPTTESLREIRNLHVLNLQETTNTTQQSAQRNGIFARNLIDYLRLFPDIPGYPQVIEKKETNKLQNNVFASSLGSCVLRCDYQRVVWQRRKK